MAAFAQREDALAQRTAQRRGVGDLTLVDVFESPQVCQGPGHSQQPVVGPQTAALRFARTQQCTLRPLPQPGRSRKTRPRQGGVKAPLTGPLAGAGRDNAFPEVAFAEACGLTVNTVGPGASMFSKVGVADGVEFDPQIEPVEQGTGEPRPIAFDDRRLAGA